MRAVVQRVDFANVIVENNKVSEINRGLLVLLGIGQNDSLEDVKWLAEKIVNLRIFEDTEYKMNNSLLDIKGDILVVSQFTLFGDCRKGRRPSFSSSANPETGNSFYNHFISYLKDNYKSLKIETGSFQKHMKVNLTNDGPVTLLLDSKKIF